MNLLVFKLSIIAVLVLYAHGDLSEQYRFSTDLSPSYKLYWTFDIQEGTIAFAVNVSTTGWIGFGLSPNGQMPRSDVIIGWVQDDGQVQFKDRFAEDRYLPSVDESQDWVLIRGKETNGHTILEFTRNLTSCDIDDLNIKADTSRVIWSYHSSDPTSTIAMHEAQGSNSLNFLSGLTQERADPTDSAEYSIVADNVIIPATDTTYWCTVGELPNVFRDQEQFIYKTSPIISEGNRPFVHHLIVYLCAELSHTHLGTSNVCEDTHIDIRMCRGSSIIAAWALGGEDFVFPPDVGLPVGGGRGSRRFVVIEMHYDNPTLKSGVLDNSGMRFLYTSTPPRHRAGALAVAAPVSPDIIIPPGAGNFTISSFCSRNCTQAYFPPDGITIFGNLLHTHLAGHGLVVEHFRQTKCGLREQLEPIDENRRYDFNYQQFNILPKPIKVFPGDEIKLSCFYRTTNRSGVTLGGDRTSDEMCDSYLYYYPKIELEFCTSLPDLSAYTELANQYIDSELHSTFFQTLEDRDNNAAREILDKIKWNQSAVTYIQDIFQARTHTSLCAGLMGPHIRTVEPIPIADCPYDPPNVCAAGERSSLANGKCCQGSGASKPKHVVTIIIVVLCTSIASVTFNL